MVEIVNNGGMTSIESQIIVAPSSIEILKDPINKNRINNMLNDLNLAHRFEEKEETCVSIAGRIMPNRFDAIKECDAVEGAHLDFLTQLDKLRNEQEQSADDTDVADDEEAEYALLCALHDAIQEFGVIVVAIPKEMLK